MTIRVLDGWVNRLTLAGARTADIACRATGFGLVRRSPGLAGLLAAQTISPLGDAMATTALILHVQRTTGSATAVGLLLFVQAIPPLAAPLAGVIADRFPPGRLLSIGWLAQAVLAGLLACCCRRWQHCSRWSSSWPWRIRRFPRRSAGASRLWWPMTISSRPMRCEAGCGSWGRCWVRRWPDCCSPHPVHSSCWAWMRLRS